MIVLEITCFLLFAATVSVDVSLASSQNQFYCSLNEVERCVDKVDNLTGCNCSVQNQTYCPSNLTCQGPEQYNESSCWNNVSCPIGPTITTEHSSATENGIAPSASRSVAASTTVAPGSHVSPTHAPTTFHPLDTDYKPIIISVAAGFACFVVFVCCMCVIHSWWLKRNKFTEVNSTPLSDLEKKRKKEELREMRRRAKEAEAKEPSKFDMGYKKPPKVNERALANYDWARTSYLPGMLEPSREPVNPEEFTPKLICDDDDTELDDPDELGGDNQGYESGKENEDGSREVTTPSSLFAPIEMEPQEPIVVEPEIIESPQELPRPRPEGHMTKSNSQDYFKMMGRF